MSSTGTIYLSTNLGDVPSNRVLPPVKTISDASYTLQNSDVGSVLVFTAGSSVSLLIPAGAMEAGYGVRWIDLSTGGVTASAGSGVTLSSPAGSATAGGGEQGLLVAPADDVIACEVLGESIAPTLSASTLYGNATGSSGLATGVPIDATLVFNGGTLGANQANLVAPKVISALAYDLITTDNQPSMLVLNGSGGSATVITVSAGVVSGGFTQDIVDYIGGGSVEVGSGVTLMAPFGSTTLSAGATMTILCPEDDVVVLGGAVGP